VIATLATSLKLKIKNTNSNRQSKYKKGFLNGKKKKERKNGKKKNT
jgi:hypothetical protein